ncbi:MAG: lipid asymmetry maintenance protein MlaB [Treponema sp.]
MARRKSADSIIVLQDSVGIEQASSIKKQFVDSIKKNKTTFVDVSKITDIDSSIIQLILAAKKEADSLQKEFFITGTIPGEISDLLSLLSVSFPVNSVEAINV